MVRLVLAVATLYSLYSPSRAVEPTCDAKTGKCEGDGQPHGGELVSAYVEDAKERETLVHGAEGTLELSERQACDVALLVSGGFSPLKGFMKKADYDGVVENMRVAESGGVLFGLPVVLDVADDHYQGKKVLLTYKGLNLAVLEAEEVWRPNKVKEAKASYGTTSVEHPSVKELFEDLGKYYVGGKVYGLVHGFEGIFGQ